MGRSSAITSVRAAIGVSTYSTRVVDPSSRGRQVVASLLRRHNVLRFLSEQRGSHQLALLYRAQIPPDSPFGPFSALPRRIFGEPPRQLIRSCLDHTAGSSMWASSAYELSVQRAPLTTSLYLAPQRRNQRHRVAHNKAWTEQAHVVIIMHDACLLSLTTRRSEVCRELPPGSGQPFLRLLTPRV